MVDGEACCYSASSVKTLRRSFNCIMIQVRTALRVGQTRSFADNVAHYVLRIWRPCPGSQLQAEFVYNSSAFHPIL